MTEKIRLGDHAKYIIEDDAFKDAMQAMKMSIFDAFRTVNVGDTDRMAEMHNLLRCADIFESKLTALVNEATAEKAKLNQPTIKRVRK